MFASANAYYTPNEKESIHFYDIFACELYRYRL